MLGETAQWVAFILFTLLTVLGALGMSTTMSMFRSGIFLMASFIGVAGLFILLSADLLGLLQIMMYIGGMLVMILFMLLFSMDPGGAMMAGMDMSPVERLFSRGLKPQDKGEEHSGQDDMAGEEDSDGEKPHDHAAMQHSGMKIDGEHDHHAMHNSDDQEGLSEQAQPQSHGEMADMDMGDEDAAHKPHDYAAINHSGMNHGAAEQQMGENHAMTHGDAGNSPTSGEKDCEHGQMDHSSMDHGDMDMGNMDMDMSMVTPARPWAAAIGIAFSAVLVGLLLWRPTWPVTSAAFSTDSPREIGMLLMGKYMMAFEGVGLLILLGIFGAVFLQRPGSHPSDQGREAYVTADKNPVSIELEPEDES
ncbi:hypothetical protein FNU79_09975 [Deinococcus detaillensis]|uniref:NADH-quinone oxidoreductase subunit J n=2 Tax=Deinococcus detaillensis TaxID=2592048 RepID=A0A553UZA9_9DEIO|nr:hypothetical protein FNU79_09975 [Deinococcus detaillensis]